MTRRGLHVVPLVACWTLAGLICGFAQTPPEPGATPGVVLTNISKNTKNFASVFPQVAVSRTNPNLIAVAWRQYNLPIDTNALKEDRIAECHVSLSKDGGQTFKDRNMMDVLRTTGGNGEICRSSFNSVIRFSSRPWSASARLRASSEFRRAFGLPACSWSFSSSAR